MACQVKRSQFKPGRAKPIQAKSPALVLQRARNHQICQELLLRHLVQGTGYSVVVREDAMRYRVQWFVGQQLLVPHLARAHPQQECGGEVRVATDSGGPVVRVMGDG